MPMTEEIRIAIFQKLKRNLESITPPMVVTKNDPNLSFEISGDKPVPYGSSKKIVPGMYFSSIAHRADSVVFYFFPAYMDPKLLEVAPLLCKCLKGKTCFHFRKEEQVNEEELTLLLEKGVTAFKTLGYMK